MKQPLRVLGVIVLAALVASTSHAATAHRILALSPHACEILAAIGAGDEMVGVVEYCDYPASLSSIPHLGGHNRIQVEAAMALEPTLAIVMNDGTKAVNKLRDLGVEVAVSNPTTIDEMMDEVLRLGVVSGHQQEAADLVAALRQRLQHLDTLKPARNIPVFYEIWEEPLLTAGGGSLIHDVLTRAGLRNVFTGLPMEGPRVNVEAVIRAKPEVIIIPTENRNIEAREQFWKKWLGEGVAVIAVQADLLHRPTPRLIDGLQTLMETIAQLPVQRPAQPPAKEGVRRE